MSSAMWQLVLRGRGVESDTHYPFKHSSDIMVFRLIRDKVNNWVLSYGITLSDDVAVMGEFVVGKGAVVFIPRDGDTSITPVNAYNVPIVPWELPDPEDSPSQQWLRPGDRISFMAQHVTVDVEPYEGPRSAVNDRNGVVEVKSSAVDGDADSPSPRPNRNGGVIGGGREKDNPDAVPNVNGRAASQMTALPYSTAQSNQVVEETPTTSRVGRACASQPEGSPLATKGRPDRLPSQESTSDEAADETEPPHPSLTVSSGTSQKRKRATQECEGEAAPTKRTKSSQASSGSSKTPATPDSSGAKSVKGTKLDSGVRVFFSMTKVKDSSAITTPLRNLGAVIATKIGESKSGSQRTVCCVGEVKKTGKILKALVLNMPVVTQDWATGSVDAGYLLDVEDFLAESIPRDVDRSKLFEDRSIIFTQAAKRSYGDNYAEVKEILELAGGEVFIKSAREIDPDDSKDSLVIGLETADNDAVGVMQKGLICFKKDLISSSIFQGELLDEDESLRLVPPTPAGKKRAKK